MLMRFDPFRELDRLTQQAIGSLRPSVMPLDVYRRGDRFVVQVDLPGVDPSSVDLSVENNELAIAAERRWEATNDDQVLAAERPHGVFRRHLFLGEGLDTDRIEASYDLGVLSITIPMAEAARPRKVEISSGGAKAIEKESAPT
jgi:HSP20 family protein